MQIILFGIAVNSLDLSMVIHTVKRHYPVSFSVPSVSFTNQGSTVAVVPILVGFPWEHNQLFLIHQKTACSHIL